MSRLVSPRLHPAAPAHRGVLEGVVLVDSLGAWVAHHSDLAVEADGLLDALARRTDPAVIVSEEVGLSVHAPTELGRRFADVLGMLNQQVAAVADP